MELSNFRECKDFLNTYVVKCALLGRFGVGKSTIGHVFSNGRFDSTLTSTIGIDFHSKIINLTEYNQNIKLQIWDTAGQEKYKSIVKSYLRDVYIAYIVFDVTDRESWNEIDKWKEMLNSTNITFVPRVVLVGTKCDKLNCNKYDFFDNLRDNGRNPGYITENEVIAKAKEWECNYYLISSKTSNSATTITNMFFTETEQFHKDVLYNYVNGKEIPYGILKDKEPDNKNINKSCCF